MSRLVRNTICQCVILILFLLLPHNARAQQVIGSKKDLTFEMSQRVLYAGAASDLLSTWRGLDKGQLEANPFLGQNRMRQGAIVMGSAVALASATRGLYRSGQ